MNQYPQYTPYFGSAMANYQPNQTMPTNLGDPLIQKLLQQQVQQQIVGAFAPQNAGQDFFSMLTGGNGAAATGAPAAVANVIKKKKQSGGGGGGGGYGMDTGPNPHLAGMWQADRYI